VNSQELIAQIRAATSAELEQLVSRYQDDPRHGVQVALRVAQRRIQQQMRESERLQSLYDRLQAAAPGLVLAGIDEVGRGALAGPLVVAAVVLPPAPLLAGLNDSKQLQPAQRRELAERIQQTALAVGWGWVAAAEIDRGGMAQAMRQAVRLALAGLELEPDQVLLDGLPLHLLPQEVAIVHGDAREASIAAASVVAKVARDAWMQDAAAEYPGYGLEDNKGYGTAEHIAAIRQLGLSAIHRQSFCSRFLQQQAALF